MWTKTFLPATVIYFRRGNNPYNASNYNTASRLIHAAMHDAIS